MGHADEIAELLSAGVVACLPDVRGTGETRPDDDSCGRSSSSTSLSSSELMLGQTLLGARVRDVRSVLRFLRSRSDVDAQRIALWGVVRQAERLRRESRRAARCR